MDEIVDLQYGQLVRINSPESIFHDRLGRISGEFWEFEHHKNYVVRLLGDENRPGMAFFQDEITEATMEKK